LWGLGEVRVKILYCGPMSRWSTTEARRRAFLELGHRVVPIDLLTHLGDGLLKKIQAHLLMGPGITSYNREIARRAQAEKPDIVWLDTGAEVWPDTVEALRSTGALVLSYNSDYLKYREYAWRHYLKAVTLYDVYVTTNELNVQILRQKGARKVVRAEFAYDPEIHTPPKLSQEDMDRFGSEAAFMGHWEPAYEEEVRHLHQAGLQTKVWGGDWRKARDKGLVREVWQHPPTVWGQEYVKALAASGIGLGVLSKWNHNQSASRTFEVPAVGGFLLAERTPDHLSYYEEGKEAEFFSTPQEMVEKARYYSGHEEERKEIADAGHRRCVTAGYTHGDRVKQILESL
jgi:hypothetical protein